MTDKVQKIREEVEKLKSQLLRGACSSQIAMETMCKEEAYNEVLAILDTMQKEPVSIWYEASKKYPLTGKEIIVLRDDKIYYGKYIGGFHRYVRAEIQLTDDTAQAYVIIDCLTKKDKWIYAEDLLNLSDVQRTTKNWKEPVKRTPADIEAAMQEVEDKSRVFTEAHKGENADTILAQMRGEEPVSEDLREAARKYFKSLKDDCFISSDIMLAFKAGAKWQKTKDESTNEDLGEYINELSKQFPEVSFAKLSRIAVRVAKWQIEHLWKPADGNDLPEYEREVVVFTQIFPDDTEMMRVAIGHRPNPNGCDGKSLSTGKVEHYTPKTYDKGGWNIPDIVCWLDVELPKEIEP